MQEAAPNSLLSQKQNSQIPKFGDWESEDNYTVYFDKARKGRSGGKPINNPNDPQQSSDVLSDDTPPVRAPPFRTDVEPEIPVGPRVAKPKHERRPSREDGDPRQLSNENLGRKATTDSYHQQHGDIGVSSGDTPKRGGRSSVGSDRSVEQSPLHPHHQAKVGGRGSGSGTGSVRSSPSWEKKPSEGSHGLAPNTPGRSRLRTATRGDETPDKGPAVPRFGDWDENDPSSADGYTHIFNKVREEKQGGAAKVPSMQNDSYSNGHKQVNGDNSTMLKLESWVQQLMFQIGFKSLLFLFRCVCRSP
ncbi:Pathogenic type III effector avirulence factor Avr cleavage site [Macleaya cordata]|uniref:Pathogenic type III effector avirulence factor Avr cleavage site n=1 Tax=Macleaya cordata TaxID=56857 RepID=A0A200PTS1_MACCD|nr:Pathogenic type III effector avirulence factor Avr cleavage site [Macleaya cordata]